MTKFVAKVTSNADQLGRKIDNLLRSQLPFATAAGLTELARTARDPIRQHMTHVFTIRNKRVLRGVRFRPANKRDWPTPQSEVGTLDEFMVLHETGGLKRPKRGASRVAVPTDLVKRQRTSTGRVPKRFKPKPAISAGKARVIGQTGRGLIRRTQPKRRTRGAQNKVKRRAILFLLRPNVRIKPRLKLQETATNYARVAYGPILKKWIERAIETARTSR